MNSGILRKLKKDKRIVNTILLYILVLACSALLIFPNYRNAIIFIIIYLLLGTLTFRVSPRWASALTVFYAMNVINIVIGTFIYLIVGAEMYINLAFVVNVSYLCMLVGYSLGINIPKIKRKTVKVRTPKIISWRIGLLLIYAVSIFASFVYWMKNASVLLSGINENRTAASGGNGIWILLINLNIIAVPYLYNEYKQGKIKHFYLMFSVAAVALLVTGFRSPLFSMIFILLINNIYNGEIRVIKALQILLILIIIGFLWGGLRGGDVSSIGTTLAAAFTSGAWNLDHVFRFFDSSNFQYGKTYFMNIEMLLPGQQMDFTLWLKEMLGLSFAGGGVTPSIMGEFYMNFGYFGMYLGMLAFGFIFSFIDKWICKDPMTPWKAYVLFLAASSCSGGIANVYLYPSLMAIWFFILNLITKKQQA